MLNQTLNIMLPGLSSKVCNVEEGSGEVLTVEFVVTEPTKVALLDVEPEKRIGDVLVDLAGKVGEYTLAIYFTHPGRAAPSDGQIPSDERCGILEVALDNVYEHIVGARTKDHSFSSALRKFLENDVSSKRWLHHPRFKRKRQQAEVELRNMVNSIRSERHAEICFVCGQCGNAWVGPASKSKCVNCNSHLYSIRKGKT